MNIKKFIFKHVEKLGIGIAVCYLIYASVHTFVILDMDAYRTDAKLLSLSNTIEKKLKTSVPPVVDTELENAEQLLLRLTSPPPASPLQHQDIFGKFIKQKTVSGVTSKDLLKKPALQPTDRLVDITPGEMEFVFKGGTADMVLLQVRKLYKDKWWTESFTTGKGEFIGKKKLMGKETVDFDTDCRLIEIVPQAQKPLIIKKTAVVRNEKGEFLGSSFTAETHMISASKIIFEDRNMVSHGLWIGELVRLGTETVAVHPLTNVSSAN